MTIAEERPPAEDAATLLDPPTGTSATQGESWEAFRVARDPERDIQAAPPASSAADAAPAGTETDLDAEIEVANRLIARGEFEAALELLNASYRARPGDDHLRRLITRTESSYVETVQRAGLAYERVPVPASPEGDGMDRLGPQECFLLSLMDGKADIRSILWVAPLREVDVLRSLRQMLDRGVIETRDAVAEGAVAPEPQEPSR